MKKLLIAIFLIALILHGKTLIFSPQQKANFKNGGFSNAFNITKLCQ